MAHLTDIFVIEKHHGSTATACQGVDAQLNFAMDDLQAQCAILPSLPNGIYMILGNDFPSKFDILMHAGKQAGRQAGMQTDMPASWGGRQKSRQAEKLWRAT
jgi:hypothetical protein